MINYWPYTCLHTLNLDWILKEIQSMRATVDDIPSLIQENTIKIGPDAYPFIDVTAPPEGVTACKCDGATDDSDALQAIIDLVEDRPGGGCIIVPGVCAISKTISIKKPISIIGFGNNATNLDQTSAIDSKSAFKMLGLSEVPMFSIDGKVSSVNIFNITFLGNGNNIGIQIDRMRESVFQNIEFINHGYAMVLAPQPSLVSDDNAMFNTFQNIQTRGKNGILIKKSSNNSNVCHCLFARCWIDYTERGVIIEDADNNTFLSCAMFNRGGVVGVDFYNAARSNVFIHFQGTMRARSGSSNIVYHYDTENGQPEPTIEDGARLLYTEGGNNSKIWSIPVPFDPLAFQVVTEDFNGVFNTNWQKNGLRFFNNNIGLGCALTFDSDRKLHFRYNPDGSDTRESLVMSQNGFDKLTLSGRQIGYAAKTQDIHLVNFPSLAVGSVIFCQDPATTGVLCWIVTSMDPITTKSVLLD